MFSSGIVDKPSDVVSCGTGFLFSENEHSALEQFEGGPCAVIAPVQVRLQRLVNFPLSSINPNK